MDKTCLDEECKTDVVNGVNSEVRELQKQVCDLHQQLRIASECDTEAILRFQQQVIILY